MSYTEQEIELLRQACDATNSRTSFYALSDAMTNLVNAGLVEGNPNLVEPGTGAIAYRARPEGLVAMQNLSAASSPSPASNTPPAPPLPPSVAKIGEVAKPTAPNFQIGAGFTPPARNPRKIVGKRKYPFEDLELNGWFFVPATPERPNPKKSLASVVSGKNKEFENFMPRRYFQAYHATQGQIFGSLVAPSDGCYVVRVEPPLPVVEPETKTS